MGKHIRTHLTRPVRRLRLEALERRALLCDVTAGVTDGVLDVAGGHFDDSIALVYSPDHQTIEVRGEGHSVAVFPASEVRSLHVQGLDGNDHISLDPSLDLPTIIDGGAGTDTVLGLSGIDQILREDGTLEARTDRSLCLSVECFQDSAAATGLTLVTPKGSEHDPVSDHGAITGVLSSVHESVRSSKGTGIVHLPSTTGTDGAYHVAHATISPLIDGGVSASSLSSHTMSDELSAEHSYTDQGHSVLPAHAETASIGENGGAEHSVGAHSFGGLSADTRTAAANPEFAIRSPYKTECPTSSPVGASAVASSSSPATVGGEVANTVSGAPKVGCKCLAMQRAAKNSKVSQNRLAMTTTAAYVVAATEAQPQDELDLLQESTKMRPSCCQESDADEGIDLIQPEPGAESSNHVQPAPTADLENGEALEAESVPNTSWQRLAVLTGVALGGLALHFHHRSQTSKSRATESEEVPVQSKS